ALAEPQALLLEQHSARERIPVGVEPERRQAEDGVAGADAAAVNDATATHVPDDASRKVVLPGRIEAGHLRGLVADHRATRAPTGLGEALNNFRDDGRTQFARRQVIAEEARPA